MSAALDLLSGLMLEDGRRWGEAAVGFQREDARAILDAESGTPYHFLTRSRGGSKTADLSGIAVAAMLAQLPPASKLYGLAADREQGRLMVDSIEGYRQRTPELGGALDVGAYRVTAARGGSVLEILAADAPGAWGLRPHLVVVDELSQWAATGSPKRLWEAASSSAAKIRGCRMVVLTTAGDPAHWSRKVLDHAIGDPLWRVHEVRGPVPWLDPERVEEQRRRLLDSSFRRLFLNEWTSSEDRLASDEDLRACVVLDGPQPPLPNRRYVIGLDVGLKSDRTVAAVCHSESLTRYEHAVGPLVVGVKVALDRMEVWQGTRERPVRLAEVEEWLYVASREYGNARLVFDPWQSVGTAQRLRASGVRCAEFTFSSASVGRLASTLHLLIRNRLLDLPDEEELLAELANVRLRETGPGVVRMDHDAGQHDDRATAFGLAALSLVEQGAPGSPDGAMVYGQTSGLLGAVNSNTWPLIDSGRFVDVAYDSKF